LIGPAGLSGSAEVFDLPVVRSSERAALAYFAAALYQIFAAVNAKKNLTQSGADTG
jgi:hypothetical protein